MASSTRLLWRLCVVSDDLSNVRAGAAEQLGWLMFAERLKHIFETNEFNPASFNEGQFRLIVDPSVHQLVLPIDALPAQVAHLLLFRRPKLLFDPVTYACFDDIGMALDRRSGALCSEFLLRLRACQCNL
jgi:hypothetical protein